MIISQSLCIILVLMSVISAFPGADVLEKLKDAAVKMMKSPDSYVPSLALGTGVLGVLAKYLEAKAERERFQNEIEKSKREADRARTESQVKLEKAKMDMEQVKSVNDEKLKRVVSEEKQKSEQEHSVMREMQEERHQKEKEKLKSLHEKEKKLLMEVLAEKEKTIAEKEALVYSVYEERINDLLLQNQKMHDLTAVLTIVLSDAARALEKAHTPTLEFKDGKMIEDGTVEDEEVSGGKGDKKIVIGKDAEAL